MTKLFFGLLAGLIFGAGLALAGMTDPAVVIGFLDVAGAWNPALLFVMGVGVVVTFIGYRLVLRRKAPLLADRFILPTATVIDRDLVLGAALFGIGWGLAGYCPGPALASLAAGRIELIAFVAAAAFGTIGVRALRRPQ
ncbi:YeeE/YedE family protein [Oleomonas cavernae]|uniref:YeeE/YedE family protein n=1 Tax=Oleomonas cavernae TaxID=2320859 RepID=A0A418WFY1_9PROT|nr:DUF6691 family protein [Oleomonas cavernae]RJF88935.1 YeeE/YedE family protein [Oleomonas cavernae]